MKFGLSMVGLRPRWYVAVAQHAETVGFESLWFGEHLVLPATMPATYLYSADGRAPLTPETPLYDAWVMLAGIATATTTIRLGTNVYVLPLRHPLVTARSVVTLDRLSGGRVTLGAGVGWLKDEFDAAGVPFEERGSRMDEIVPLLRELWSSDGPLGHEGRHYRFDPVMFRPRAIQKPSIPIELGGTSKPAMRRAAVLGDGWIELGSRDVEELGDRIRWVLDVRKEAARDCPFEITSGPGADLAEVSACERVGVTRVVTHCPSLSASSNVDDVHDWLDDYAVRVIDQVPRR